MADHIMPNFDADELRLGLESLPQELYDQIYNAVFTAPPGERNLSKRNKCNNIAEGLKLLQISHATREKYAASYFGDGGEFLIEDCWVGASMFVAWLRSIAAAHRALLWKIIIVCECCRPPDVPSGEDALEDIKMDLRRMIHDTAARDALLKKVFVKVDGTLYG